MKVRFVAMTYDAMLVQINNGNWNQVRMTRGEFESFMIWVLPTAYRDYIESGSDDILKFFYHYNETSEMRRKGEAYIFNTERSL